jgi:hypothetical protein
MYQALFSPWEYQRTTNKQAYDVVQCFSVSLFFFFSVLGFELRAYTLSHSTSTFL